MAEPVLHLQHGKIMDCEKKGIWSPEEDKKLIDYITKHGIWNRCLMPKYAGLSRSGKSCRLRWMNYLRPDLKRGPFHPEETQTVIRMYQSLGNRWSAIAKELPGRTDNEIKNFYHTHLKKRLGTIGEVNKPLLTTYPIQDPACSTSSDDQSLAKSPPSSYITFDKNYDFMETSDQDNDVTSVVNQVDDENIVILESNTSSLDLLIKELTDTSVDVYKCWLGLYMAGNNLKP